jgi:hypothetical protein
MTINVGAQVFELLIFKQKRSRHFKVSKETNGHLKISKQTLAL